MNYFFKLVSTSDLVTRLLIYFLFRWANAGQDVQAKFNGMATGDQQRYIREKKDYVRRSLGVKKDLSP